MHLTRECLDGRNDFRRLTRVDPPLNTRSSLSRCSTVPRDPLSATCVCKQAPNVSRWASIAASSKCTNYKNSKFVEAVRHPGNDAKLPPRGRFSRKSKPLIRLGEIVICHCHEIPASVRKDARANSSSTTATRATKVLTRSPPKPPMFLPHTALSATRWSASCSLLPRSAEQNYRHRQHPPKALKKATWSKVTAKWKVAGARLFQPRLRRCRETRQHAWCGARSRSGRSFGAARWLMWVGFLLFSTCDVNWLRLQYGVDGAMITSD